MIRRRIFAMLALVGAFAPTSASMATEDLTNTLPRRQGGRADFGATLPVEQVLDDLRRTRGLAFIFDSRLIAGKEVRPMSSSGQPQRELEVRLSSINLRLHQIADKTYAITENSIAPARPEIIAPAAVEPPMPIDTILVMGSTSSAPAVTGSKRIFKLDADDLAYLNSASPAETIYSLPQSLASFTPSNTALYAAAAGISLADMRGLSPKRTMVLVDGRRRTITTGGNGEIGGVDLGSVSEPLLERIEVQNLPGGARFGAASVAGTINFVTKSIGDGLEAGARFGISERGDAEEISIHVLGGRQIENFGAFNIGLNVTRGEGLVGADREFSAVPYGFAYNGFQNRSLLATFLPGFGGSVTTGRGQVGGVILSDGSFSSFSNGVSYVPAADGSIAPFQGALDQLFNWAQWQTTILPSDRIIGQMSFHTDPTGQLKFFVEAQGGIAANDNSLAPLPASRFRGAHSLTGDAAVIPLSNPSIPQSIRDIVQTEFGPSASAVVFEHRFVELGPRRQQVDRRHIDVTAGVRIGEDDTRSAALTYRFGSATTKSRESDRVDLNKLNIALDPSKCAITHGCSAVDFFTAPAISQAAIDFITIPQVKRTLTIEEHEVSAAASRTFLFDSDNEGRASAGIEYRSATFMDRDMAPDGSAIIGYIGGANLSESLETIDGYAELETPLFYSDTFPGDLDASLAVRLTYSPNFDFAGNFEAGFDWRPLPGVSFFTRQHVGERTPDIIEMYSIGPTLETLFIDPCGADPADQSATVRANCESNGPLGAGIGFVQTAPLAAVTYYGNPNLKSESVRSSVYGLAISPTEFLSALPGRLQIAASWLDFAIRDAISDPTSILDDCYSSPDFASPLCGVNPRTGRLSIARDPNTRQVVSLDGALFNGGELQWRGLDLELRYAFEPAYLPFVDSLWISALHTYTDQVVSRRGGSYLRLDGLINHPSHRTLASFGIESGRWSFVTNVNRRGRAVTARSSRSEAKLAAALYLDFAGRFDFTDSTYVQVGVKNITDRKPEITAFNSVGNFAPEFYDPIGRRYSLAVRVNF